MPESKGRPKPAYTPPPTKRVPKAAQVNPPWFAPVMVGLMVVGLLWTATFYITGQQYPIPSLGRWNLGVGFGLMLAGFAMTTRWR
ncbi:MAG: cell division protein CrgA [Nostocoides sp.]